MWNWIKKLFGFAQTIRESEVGQIAEALARKKNPVEAEIAGRVLDKLGGDDG